MPLGAGFAALLELGAGALSGSPVPDAAVFGALVGVAIAAIAALATFGELWLDSYPVVGPDRILAAAAVVYMASALILYVALGQVSYGLGAIRGGSPLEGLAVATRGGGPMAGLVAWLREPSVLCALAAPYGALAAVRGDDEDGVRPWRREAPAVAALSLGIALLTALVFALLGIHSTLANGITLEGAVLRLVVVPALAFALATAAAAGDVLEVKAKHWLEGGDSA